MAGRGDYSEYIHSSEWNRKLKYWLRYEAQYHCELFPWLIVGKKRKGKYRGYRGHHTTYVNRGHEVYGQDVVIVSKIAHDLILHGICSGFRSAGKQKTPYPNRAQRILHAWCALSIPLKLRCIAVAKVVGGILAAVGWFGLVCAFTYYRTLEGM